MKRVFQGIVSVFVLAVLNVLSLGMHAVATLPTNMGHSMGASHQASASNCFTICTTATLQKEEVVKDIENEDDDKFHPPFYSQFQTSPLLAIKEKHSQETRYAIDQEPPPNGAPAYIALTVFRA